MSAAIKIWYSAAEIATLGRALIGGLPTSDRGAGRRAKVDQWERRMVRGKGGKGGLKTEYKLPEEVMKIVRMFLNENPDFFKKDDKETASSKHYPINASNPSKVVTGEDEQNHTALQSHSGNGDGVNYYITLPKYALQTMPNQAINSDQVVDHLAFKKDWVEKALNIYDNSLALIRVKDDSMEPTLKSDDLILTELNQGEIDGDSIYVLRFGNTLTLRRIQRKMDGSLLVFSDNKKYKEEEYDGEKAKNLPVIGKVVWFGRRI